MKRFEIKYIQLGSTNPCPWNSIIKLGGINSDGSVWILDPSMVLQLIEQKRMNFCIVAKNSIYDIRIEKNKYGEAYLATDLDNGEGMYFEIMQLAPFPENDIQNTSISMNKPEI